MLLLKIQKYGKILCIVKQSFVDSFPGVIETVQDDPVAAYFARVAVRNSAEMALDANAAIVMRAQDTLRPALMADILQPAEAIYDGFKATLMSQPPHMRFTQEGPSIFWVMQRHGALASGRQHIIQTCVEVTAPYSVLSEQTMADIADAQRLIEQGQQPDHDIFGVHREARLGLGKLFGFKPYEQTTLAASLAEEIFATDTAQLTMYTAVDHGEGLQPQVLGRFRFNHAQHVARKAQYVDPANASRLSQTILAQDHELSAAGAETYLRSHIGWSMPSDYDHLRKVQTVLEQSVPVENNNDCIAPIFAYTQAA